MPGPLRIRSNQRCTYCDRVLNAAWRMGACSATRDHVLPQSAGGRSWVLACRQCNQLKGDLAPAAWRTFMEMHPRWWQRFATAKEVRLAIAVLEAASVAQVMA